MRDGGLDEQKEEDSAVNMTISTTDFPTWFFAGFYGGLVCCVFTIAISLCALYTDIRRHVMTRRPIVVAVACGASFLCLWPTFVWFRVRFYTQVSLTEITVLLCCVALFGWLLPIGATFSSSFLSRSSLHSTQQKSSQAESYPPRYQSGVMAPFVFSAETAWGWLEYRSGNFQGQRLALKRSIITLGRAEDSDIWLDDDMASRRHAEVAWDKDIAYLTDCDSLNSTRLNGKRVRGSVLLSSEDIIEIGTHRFLFLLAEQKVVTTEQYDPLVNHKWRSSFELQESRETTQYSVPLPATKPLVDTGQVNTESQHVEPHTAVSKSHTPLPATKPLVDTGQVNTESQHVEPHTVASKLRAPLPATKPLVDTGQVNTESQHVEPHTVASKSHTPPSLPKARGRLLVGNGTLAGKAFLLQSLSVLVGSGPYCDLVVPNLGLTPQHARFIREVQGDYIQDLSGLGEQGGTLINGEPVQGMKLLQPGDGLRIGSFHLTYLSALEASEEQASFSQRAVPASAPPISGPMPLRLPSRPKGT